MKILHSQYFQWQVLLLFTWAPTVVSKIMDQSGPYFLYPSNSPIMCLVKSDFEGKGYEGWRRSIFIALSAKTKLGLLMEVARVPVPTIHICSYRTGLTTWSLASCWIHSLWTLLLIEFSTSKQLKRSGLTLRSHLDNWMELNFFIFKKREWFLPKITQYCGILNQNQWIVGWTSYFKHKGHLFLHLFYLKISKK